MVTNRRICGELIQASFRRCFAFLLAALSCWVAHAGEAPTAIRVVLDDNYPPYIFRDAKGQPQGVLKDLWDLWQQRTGIRVDFQPMDWGKARAVMESGQADVIDTIFETPARQKIYDFSKPYATIEVPLFFHQSISGITDAASVKGFTVAVKEGDACVDYLTANGIDTLKSYASYEAQVKAAVAQEIRVLCIDKPPGLYFFNRDGAADQFRYSPALYLGEFHWAVAKGQTDLKRAVEAGFARISAGERAAIERRWLGSKLDTVAWPGVARYAAYALLTVMAAMIALFIWNGTLRRRVAARTAELELTHGAMRESEARYRALTELSSDWYWEQDESLRFVSLSKAFDGQSNIDINLPVGHTRREVPGMVWDETELRQLEAITAAQQPFRNFELGRCYRNEPKQYLRLSGEPIFDTNGAFRGYRGVGCDITDRRKMEEQIHHLAFYDPLTQLPNRRLLNDRLNQAMASSKRAGLYCALMMLDLDNFKPLNDRSGHRAGDLLLVDLANRLAACIRESDTVARMGGDEFAVLLSGLADGHDESLAHARIIAEKIRLKLAEVYRLTLRDDDGTETLIEHQCTASIGVVLFFGLEASRDTLLDGADALMYQAKTAGRNSICYQQATGAASAN